MSFEIAIPADSDGYALMECPLCGELFKMCPSDIEDDDVLEIRCPKCGIASDNYLTEDVEELVLAKAANWVFGEIHEEMKKLERKTNGKDVQLKAGKQPEHEYEPVLMPTIEALGETACENCKRPMKLAPALLFTAYCCPYCGVSNFNER